MTKCGSTDISYNAMGCPVTYDCLNISWTRGKISKLSRGDKISGTKTYNYNYNAYGQRTSRSYTYGLPMLDGSAVAMGTLTGYGQTFSYDESGRLIREGKSSEYYGEVGSSDSIVYLYDANSIIGMLYTADGATNTYYFQRNLLGDVIGIYDTSGAKVGGYAYDAWGNCTITLNTNGIATRNPIRYRGYYYDADTNLYYLNARYYSPELRRFISPDDTAYLDPKTPNGLNLYCYCNNDPVNYADPSGRSAVMVTIAIIGISALIGTTIGAVSSGLAYVATAGDSYSTQGLIGAIAGGAVSGFITGFAAGTIAAFPALSCATVGIYAAAGFLGGVAGSLTQTLVESGGNYASINAESIALAISTGVWNAAFSALSGYIGMNFASAKIGGIIGSSFRKIPNEMLRNYLLTTIPDAGFDLGMEFISWLCKNEVRYYYNKTIGTMVNINNSSVCATI